MRPSRFGHHVGLDVSVAGLLERAAEAAAGLRETREVVAAAQHEKRRRVAADKRDGRHGEAPGRVCACRPLVERALWIPCQRRVREIVDTAQGDYARHARRIRVDARKISGVQAEHRRDERPEPVAAKHDPLWIEAELVPVPGQLRDHARDVACAGLEQIAVGDRKANNRGGDPLPLHLVAERRSHGVVVIGHRPQPADDEHEERWGSRGGAGSRGARAAGHV